MQVTFRCVSRRTLVEVFLAQPNIFILSTFSQPAAGAGLISNTVNIPLSQGTKSSKYTLIYELNTEANCLQYINMQHRGSVF